LDLLTFIAHLIASFVWPSVVLLGIIILRKELRLLIPSLQRLRYKDLELDFGKRVEQIEEQANQANLPPAPKQLALPAPRTAIEALQDVIAVSPRLAVIEAFNYVEAAVREAGIKHEIAKDKFAGVRNIVRGLKEAGLVSDVMSALFNQLRALRNELSHSTNIEISPEDARKYAVQALRLVNAISAHKRNPTNRCR